MTAAEEIPVPSAPDLRVWARELCDQLAPMPPEAITRLVALYAEIDARHTGQQAA